MPDTYMSTTKAMPVMDTSSVNADMHDDPALAVQKPMEMSAPIEAMPFSEPLIQPAAEAPPEAPQYPAPVLSDLVAPFTTAQPTMPAVEYVPTSSLVHDIIAPPPVTRRSTQLAPASPVNLMPVPPLAPVAVPLQAVPAPQAPTTSMPPPPVPAVASVMAVSAAPTPLAVSVPQPSTFQAPPQQVPPAAVPVAAPAPMRGDRTYAPSDTVVPTTLASPEVSPGAAMPAWATPAMYYSHNTEAIWQVRRVTRMFYIAACIAVAVLVGIVFVYWLSIGSPTRVQDIPLLQNLSG